MTDHFTITPLMENQQYMVSYGFNFVVDLNQDRKKIFLSLKGTYKPKLPKWRKEKEKIRGHGADCRWIPRRRTDQQ